MGNPEVISSPVGLVPTNALAVTVKLPNWILETENKFRSSYPVGGSGGVSGYDEMRGNIQLAEHAGDGR
jgi:hypothetical protein